MIEKDFLDFLLHKIEEKGYLEEPTNPPQRYFTLERTSGGGNRFVREATIAVKAYAPTLAEAAALSHEIVKAADDFIENEKVTRCTLNTEANFTDLQRRRHRYQAVFDISYYE